MYKSFDYMYFLTMKKKITNNIKYTKNATYLQ